MDTNEGANVDLSIKVKIARTFFLFLLAIHNMNMEHHLAEARLPRKLRISIAASSSVESADK